MPRKERAIYPWGTGFPGPRLRTTCAKARAALEQADAPGFDRIAKNINALMKSIRPFVITMQYVAGAGLRSATPDEKAVSGQGVSDAVRAVHEALPALATASPSTLTPRYEALAGAVLALADLADTASAHGIKATGEPDPNNPWAAFKV